MPWMDHYEVGELAARTGNQEVFAMMQKKYPMEHHMHTMIQRGRLSLLRFCIEQCHFPLKNELVQTAVSSDQHDCLIYLLQANCPWNVEYLYNAIIHGRNQMFKTLHDTRRFVPSDCPHVFIAAVEVGSHDLLPFLLENKYPFNEKTLEAAVRYNNLYGVKFLCENGCPMNTNATCFASKLPTLKILDYLRERQCPIDEKAVDIMIHGPWMEDDSEADSTRHVYDSSSDSDSD